MTHRPLSERVREKLLAMARANSESFARSMMAAAAALDDAQDVDGLEFVDSLNGLDIYDDVSHAKAVASTRLRSFCHLDADIHDVARKLTATASARRLPGIVETRELCSVLSPAETAPPEKEFPERAGVNWFVVDRESTRDSIVANSRSEALRQRVSSRDSSDNVAVGYLVLSYQGVFKHRGRRGWLQWCQSIELSSFPPCPKGIKRGVLFSSGIVAVESATRKGQVSMCYAMGVDLSACDPRERRLLENAVWKRVMKLAALKKAMLRESSSSSTTLSITSAEWAEQEQDAPATTTSQSQQKVSPMAKKQPECEPTTKSSDDKYETKTKTLKDKRRQRAQTMEPTPTSPCPIERPHNRSLFREPSSLEFRLTFYNDPDEDVHELRDSVAVLEDNSKEPRGSRFSSVFKASKGSRPLSRSFTGWL